jgi:hypothetical protein
VFSQRECDEEKSAREKERVKDVITV